MSSEGVRREEAVPIWARPAPGARRPSLSRERIAEAAIAVADAEGWEAVSMRRIATDLGAGTMTLYHYVQNKDELVALVSDAIMAELLVPDDELPGGWREGMAEIGRRTRAIFHRHPWIVERMGEGDPGYAGPGVLRHVEQTMAVAARTGLPVEQQMELAAIVDDYVFGHAIRTFHDAREGSREGALERFDAMLPYFTEQLATGQYPHLAAVAGDDPRASFARIAHLTASEDRFERGLQRVLDGLDRWVGDARAAQARRDAGG
jgi:AcrR family transcriptional regulator